MKQLGAFILIVFLCGCSAGEFGEKLSIDKFTSLELLHKYPANYLNKFVKVKGQVVEESSAQQWITLRDDGNIMINLEKIGNVPDITGKNVIVEGQFIQTKDGYSMIGRWLQVK